MSFFVLKLVREKRAAVKKSNTVTRELALSEEDMQNLNSKVADFDTRIATRRAHVEQLEVEIAVIKQQIAESSSAHEVALASSRVEAHKAGVEKGLAEYPSTVAHTAAVLAAAKAKFTSLSDDFAKDYIGKVRMLAPGFPFDKLGPYSSFAVNHVADLQRKEAEAASLSLIFGYGNDDIALGIDFMDMLS